MEQKNIIEIKGKHNCAKIFAEIVDETSISQIQGMCNENIGDSNIVIMPDVHAGKGCTIGTTMTISNKVVPNLVGVDIGCGVKVVELGNIELDLENFDKVVSENIPAGFNLRKSELKEFSSKINLEELKCYKDIKKNNFNCAIGTLGGGNHFIEVDVDDNGVKYLVIHTGSRNLGKTVAEHYQQIAFKTRKMEENGMKELIDNKIKELQSQGKEFQIEEEIKVIKKSFAGKSINPDMAWLEGDDFNNYIHDINIVQKYSELNRSAIAETILLKYGIEKISEFTSIHNYIDTEKMILRKGAISAMEGQKVVIPLNIKDGCIIAIGKGNPEWNYSAPHGAGRIMSRSQAKTAIDVEDFIDEMKGIYSTSIGINTLDEAPKAYKGKESIINIIGETVKIEKIIKPIYAFKAH